MAFTKNFFGVVGYTTKDFLALLATALKNLLALYPTALKVQFGHFRPKPS
jgi:hypothetical protein